MSCLMVGNGSSLGFVSQEEETELGELPVDGSFPEWLRGALIRTGPAKWEVGRRTMNVREPLPRDQRVPRGARPG